MIKLVGFTKDNSITMGGMTMKWLKYRLETTTEATDLIIDMLAELGIYGVEVIDKVPLTEAMWIFFLKASPMTEVRSLCFI